MKSISINFIMLWFLQLLKNDKPISVADAKNSFRVTQEFDIRDNEKYSSNQLTVFDVKFGWARYYLKQSELIISPSRGIFLITLKGKELISSEPIELVVKFNRDSSLYEVLSTSVDVIIEKPSTKEFKNETENQEFISFLKNIEQPLQFLDATKSPHVKDGVIELLFGTCRAKNASSNNKKFFDKTRGTELETGVAYVSVPSKHLAGVIERPPWYYWWKEKKGRDFILDSIQILGPISFSEHINKKYKDGLPRVFVFVHGFQVSFERAALHTAQMAIDLGLESCPAFFSWPSDVGLKKYAQAAVVAGWAGAYLADFLEKFALEAKAAEVVVIAHSMGSRVAARAIAIVRTRSPENADKFKELILAAPDLDAGEFEKDFMPEFARLNQSVTIYACKVDVALTLSNEKNGAPRAGDIPAGLIDHPSLETIDATNVATDFLGHSYFSNNNSLISDLKSLIVGKKRAASRKNTLAPQLYENITYWLLKKSLVIK